MSIYVVGDIQGCAAELNALLNLIDFKPQTDELWALGDLINRGPANVETIQILMGLPNFKTVLGNHDLHFLAVAYTDRALSRSDTIQDLLDHQERGQTIDWLRRQPLALYNERHDIFLSHAGIPSNWTIEQALGYAAEVEHVLQSDDPTSYFSSMYGNLPDRFADSLLGIDRLRCITNYLTRLRFCNAEGQLELQTKTDIAPTGYEPWFDFPRKDKTKILFGHWAALEGKTPSSQFIALDTGCVWGRSLTALRLEDFKRFSVPASSSS